MSGTEFYLKDTAGVLRSTPKWYNTRKRDVSEHKHILGVFVVLF